MHSHIHTHTEKCISIKYTHIYTHKRHTYIHMYDNTLVLSYQIIYPDSDLGQSNIYMYNYAVGRNSPDGEGPENRASLPGFRSRSSQPGGLIA